MHFFKDNVHFSCRLIMALAAWRFSSWKKVTSSTCIMELEIIGYCLSFDAYIIRMLMVCWKDTRTKEWKTFWNYTIKPLCGMMVCTSLNCKKKRMMQFVWMALLLHFWQYESSVIQLHLYWIKIKANRAFPLFRYTVICP